MYCSGLESLNNKVKVLSHKVVNVVTDFQFNSEAQFLFSFFFLPTFSFFVFVFIVIECVCLQPTLQGVLQWEMSTQWNSKAFDLISALSTFPQYNKI